MKYLIYQDTQDRKLVAKTDEFIKALKLAKQLSIKKCDKFFIEYDSPDSDMLIAFDPLGRQEVL